MTGLGKTYGLMFEIAALLLACVLLQSILLRIVNALPYRFRRPLHWLHLLANSIQALLRFRRSGSAPKLLARTGR